MTNNAEPLLTVGELDTELRGELEKGLTEYNKAYTDGAEQGSLSVRVTAPDGGIAGGLHAWTWGGCLGITLVWLREDCRGGGWGSKVLLAAEREAVRRGCDRAVVSSFTFQAPGFYERHGYRETGRMLGVPGGHEDVWLYKALTPQD